MSTISTSSVRVTHRSDLAWVHHLGREYCDITPDGAQFECALSRMEPGGCSTRHSHLVAEQFVIISGQAIVHLGDAQIMLTKSEIAFVPSMIEHHLSNPSDVEPLEYLLLCWTPAAHSVATHNIETELK